MSYILERMKTEQIWKGGRFTFATVDELSQGEQELDFKPKRLVIFETTFYKAVTEATFL